MRKVKGADVRLFTGAATIALSVANAASAAAELKVTVTIKPIHALVAGVMAGVGAPALLITGTASPHTYGMKPSDAKALHTSDVFFRVSEAVEPFTGRVVQSLSKDLRVVTLADAPGVTRLDVRTGDTFEAHAHGDTEDEHGHDDDDDHGDEAAKGDHDEQETGDRDDRAHRGHARVDGHVWLDPANAKEMIAEIARVLSEIAPEHAGTFRKNAEVVSAGIDALEAEIERSLEPVKGRPFVVFHDAYQYFERRFGLHAVGSITVSPEVQPSAKRLTEIRKKIASLRAACVFAEPQFQPRLVDAVIEGTSARAGTLDPEGALVAPGPDAYKTLLKNLAAGLEACLVQGS